MRRPLHHRHPPPQSDGPQHLRACAPQPPGRVAEGGKTYTAAVRCDLLPAPVLAACGWSGAGKTTLLEAAIPRLLASGLRVAAVKHDAHGVQVDRPGKDSDRLFRAGASVVLRSPSECFARLPAGSDTGLERALRALAATHDLVLVEGHKDTPLPKVWLEHEDGTPPPPSLTHLLATLPDDDGRLAVFLNLAEQVVQRHFAARPLLGGALVGGASTRMGRPKHLARVGGRSLLQRVADALSPHAQGVVLLGEAPRTASHLRVPDAPGVAGPLAGILAALRSHPTAAWLIAACDMPALTPQALAWVLSHRRPGVWAVIPRDCQGHLEPLAALWEPQAAPLLEDLLLRGEVAPRLVAPHPKVLTPDLPPDVAPALANVNTPNELATARRRLAKVPRRRRC